MSETETVVTLESVIEPMGAWRILRIPAASVEPLAFKGNSRRVACSLKGSRPFQCALLPAKKGGYVIVANKKLRKELNIEDGDTVRIELRKDTTKYGLPMPKELKEVLRQDKEGDKLFHALTPGKQRTMLYYIAKTKDLDRRIQWALILVEHLKQNDGKIVFRKLSEELKRPMAEF